MAENYKLFHWKLEALNHAFPGDVIVGAQNVKEAREIVKTEFLEYLFTEYNYRDGYREGFKMAGGLIGDIYLDKIKQLNKDLEKEPDVSAAVFIEGSS